MILSPTDFLHQSDDLFLSASNMEHLTNVINDIDTEKSKLKPHKLLYDD